MAGAESGAEGGGAARAAPLDAEQLRRVLERVAGARPPPFALQAAAPQAAPRPPPPQQLEAICVKMSSDAKGKERPVPPLVTVQPKPGRQSQLPGRSSITVEPCITGPQLLSAPPLERTGSQPCPFGGSLRPLKPLPALQPVPAKTVKAPLAAKGPAIPQTPSAASAPTLVTSVSSSSAQLFISGVRAAHTDKLKKSLKVKTRSGRISRPPKHKAKDYKFIKREDLADGHPSDSDDYSELSVEEEEEQREKRVPFDVEGCTLRPKAFKCQTCDKSYIGKGGLARHFKLNPSHGYLELAMSQCEKASGKLTPSRVDLQTRGLAASELSTPAAPRREESQGGLQDTNYTGQSVVVEETRNPELETGATLGPEHRLEPGSGESRSSTAAGQQSRAARAHRGPAVAAGSRARLKEALQQCGREDLVELALPQLAQAVNLCEFLLVKVEKDHLAKPFFPAVYKEFEALHHMVKEMCQDYLRSSRPCSLEPLEVTSRTVAESLGIPEELLQKRETRVDATAPKHRSGELEGKLEEASGQKRERKLGMAGTGEGLDTVKKPRRAALPTDAPECTATSRCREKPWPSHVPAVSDGLAPAAKENPFPHSEESCREKSSAGDGSAAPAGQQLAAVACADGDARRGPVGPVGLCQGITGPTLYAQLAEPRSQP